MVADLTRPAEPVAAAAPDPSSLPASPPGYELIEKIGHGGMGVVYRARDTALDRDVAVKLLSERYPGDSPAAQRFLSEARITGQLQHPGIPAVHQVGSLADGRPFLAMKLIKGSTLEVLLKQRLDPAVDRGRLLAIFEAVCQAVGYAHAHGVIHRDLKPSNVMVGAFGEVQVMDWGLAKVIGQQTPATVEAAAAQTQAWTQVSPTPEGAAQTQAGSLVGTPAFIAPEQALGELDKVNERADVFGLGALLAMILTGKPPYLGETFEVLRVQAARGKLDDCFGRLDASGAEPELVALCKKCLAFEPADRPQDAGAVAQAVAGLRAAADERARQAELDRVRAEGEQARAQAEAREQRKRRRVQLGLGAAVMVCALVSVIAGWLIASERQERRLDAVRSVTEAAGRAALACEQARSFRPKGLENAAAREVVLAWERADEAVRQADAAISQAPAAAQTDAAERVASLLMEVTERLTTARKELDRILEKEKLLREADRLATEEQAAQAAELARQAARLDPKSPWSHLELGDLLAGLGSYDEAREAYKTAQSLPPDKSSPNGGRNRMALQNRTRLRLERLERYAKLESGLTTYVRAGTATAGRDDLLLLAEVCFLRGYYVGAAKLHQATFQGAPPEINTSDAQLSLAVRAYVFAGCGLGKDRVQLDERGRSEFRSAAWKLSRMAEYVYGGGASRDAPTTWMDLGEFLKRREDRNHRLVLYPGPCLPDPKRIDGFHFNPKEMADAQKLIFAYSRWITGQILRMEALEFLMDPLEAGTLTYWDGKYL
jgi:tetratricopeptide (TPR) repeat protein